MIAELVPSRPEGLPGPTTGDDKRRPYDVLCRLRARSHHGRPQGLPCESPGGRTSTPLNGRASAGKRNRRYTSRWPATTPGLGCETSSTAGRASSRWSGLALGSTLLATLGCAASLFLTFVGVSKLIALPDVRGCLEAHPAATRRGLAVAGTVHPRRNDARPALVARVDEAIVRPRTERLIVLDGRRTPVCLARCRTSGPAHRLDGARAFGSTGVLHQRNSQRERSSRSR